MSGRDIELPPTAKSVKDLFERFREKANRGRIAPVTRLYSACVHCSMYYRAHDIEAHQLICIQNPDNGWVVFEVLGKKFVEKESNYTVVKTNSGRSKRPWTQDKNYITEGGRIGAPDLRIACILWYDREHAILQDDAFDLLKTMPSCIEKIGHIRFQGTQRFYFRVRDKVVWTDAELDFLDYRVRSAIQKARSAGARL